MGWQGLGTDCLLWYRYYSRPAELALAWGQATTMVCEPNVRGMVVVVVLYRYPYVLGGVGGHRQ